MCKEAGGGGEGARDTESKTRTPHKVVGKKIWCLQKITNYIDQSSVLNLNFIVMCNGW